MMDEIGEKDDMGEAVSPDGPQLNLRSSLESSD